MVTDPAITAELTDILSQSVHANTNSSFEECLIRFLRHHHHLLSAGAENREVAAVATACRILRETVDAPVRLPDLRLSKARRLICDGQPLAQAAVEAGFTDQAHLTREFKRVFGTTPGTLARDLTPA